MDDETLAADDRMDQPEIPFPAVLVSLSVGQSCGLAVAHVALMMALIGLGTWLQAARDDNGRPEGAPDIPALISENNKLAGERNDAQRQSDAAQALLRSEVADRQALQAKADFLERVLTYRMSATPAARTRLVDYVCDLWSQPAKFRIQMDHAPVDITAAEIRSGLSLEKRNYLVHEGVPAVFLQQAQGSRPAQAAPHTLPPPLFPTFLTTPSVADEAVDRILRQAHSLRAIKAVRFYDESIYQIPQEVAFAVHTRADCAPF